MLVWDTALALDVPLSRISLQLSFTDLILLRTEFSREVMYSVSLLVENERGFRFFGCHYL